MDRNGSHLAAVGARRGNYYAGMVRMYEAMARSGDGTGGSPTIASKLLCIL
jgi:hypothetical protein